MTRIVHSTLVLLLISGLALVVATQSADAQDEPGGDGKTTILLMGGDAGPQRIGIRTDSMMVASIDRETGRAALFGVPRPGHPYWDEATVDAMAAKYPGLDVGPWRDALG